MKPYKKLTVSYMPAEDEKSVTIELTSDERLSLYDLKQGLDQLVEELDTAIEEEMEKSSNA